MRVQVKALIPRLMHYASVKGNKLGNLYPTRPGYWWPLLEDVFTSPAVTAHTSPTPSFPGLDLQ
jgi:hypothetical protein